jgi:hypothetical protein
MHGTALDGTTVDGTTVDTKPTIAIDYWSLPNRHPRCGTSAVVGQNKQGEVVILLPKECKQLAR